MQEVAHFINGEWEKTGTTLDCSGLDYLDTEYFPWSPCRGTNAKGFDLAELLAAA